MIQASGNEAWTDAVSKCPEWSDTIVLPSRNFILIKYS